MRVSICNKTIIRLERVPLFDLGTVGDLNDSPLSTMILETVCSQCKGTKQTPLSTMIIVTVCS